MPGAHKQSIRDEMKVALLGAECTGKTTLAHQLTQTLASRGLDAACIDEYLRHWCERSQRTPGPYEQSGIAMAQAQRINNTQAQMLIADTTPLMTAVYSDFYFHDASLYPLALAFQRGFDCTLLLGSDLPWVADGLQRDGPQVRQQMDTLLRKVLSQAAVPYRSIEGAGAQRLQQALQALGL